MSENADCFEKLPSVIKADIMQLLKHGQFPEAKELYERSLNALLKKQQKSGICDNSI